MFLNGCYHLTSPCSKYISTCSSLTELHLSDCSPLDDKFLAILFDSNLRLQKLILKKFKGSYSSLRALRNSELKNSLTFLDISSWELLPTRDWEVNITRGTFSKIETLHISSSTPIPNLVELLCTQEI